MITTNEINYSNYGRCLYITNEKIELVVTLDFGPRIIRAAFVGKDNFIWENPDWKKEYDADKSKFCVFGGHRLWVSPEIEDTYYPDNEPVEYAVKNNTVSLTPPPQTTGFQLQIEIIMDENENRVDLRHYLTNVSGTERRVAPWAITMLANGGNEIIPVNDNDTGYLPNRYVVLWPYTKMNDPRILWGDQYMVLDQTQAMADKMETPFKIGISQIHPWAAYIKGKQIFMKRYTVYDDREYPDGNCTFETYSCKDFVEMETVGALKTLAKGDTAIHDEIWCFFDNAEFNF